MQPGDQASSIGIAEPTASSRSRMIWPRRQDSRCEGQRERTLLNAVATVAPSDRLRKFYEKSKGMVLSEPGALPSGHEVEGRGAVNTVPMTSPVFRDNSALAYK
jgi:hypothetical protein